MKDELPNWHICQELHRHYEIRRNPRRGQLSPSLRGLVRRTHVVVCMVVGCPKVVDGNMISEQRVRPMYAWCCHKNEQRMYFT